MPMPTLNPEWNVRSNSPLDQLLQTLNQPLETVAHSGSVITFGYTGQTRHRIHDPTPMVLVCDISTDMVRGINLHYLTLPYIRGLVSNYANQRGFSYRNIIGDGYIVGAFRSYKRNGISQLRMLDAAFLRNLLTIVRALEPGEIDQMREQIHNLIDAQVNPQPQAQPGPQITGQQPPAQPGQGTI